MADSCTGRPSGRPRWLLVVRSCTGRPKTPNRTAKRAPGPQLPRYMVSEYGASNKGT
jgi:hypothetical protein